MYSKEVVFEKLLLIRETELRIEKLFSAGLLRGTTHGCIGQEAVPVALSEFINIDDDYLTGGHRSHGYAISFSNSPELMLGEVMGKKCGFESGKGGSQHIHYKNFFTNGITGGMAPICAGIAFALKQRKNNLISVAVLGDGAMNEGYVLETLNLAGVLSLPIFFVLENNGYAMSTSINYATSGKLSDRVKGFGLKYDFITANDYYLLSKKIGEMVTSVRINRTPAFLEIETHRFSGHSKSDKREYMSEERERFWQKNDILKKLEDEISPEVSESIKNRITRIIEDAYLVCQTSE
jgi:TPP-dependent pyruvate/acetoin dehydrogenase alpha subunit